MNAQYIHDKLRDVIEALKTKVDDIIDIDDPLNEIEEISHLFMGSLFIEDGAIYYEGLIIAITDDETLAYNVCGDEPSDDIMGAVGLSLLRDIMGRDPDEWETDDGEIQVWWKLANKDIKQLRVHLRPLTKTIKAYWKP